MTRAEVQAQAKIHITRTMQWLAWQQADRHQHDSSVIAGVHNHDRDSEYEVLQDPCVWHDGTMVVSSHNPLLRSIWSCLGIDLTKSRYSCHVDLNTRGHVFCWFCPLFDSLRKIKHVAQPGQPLSDTRHIFQTRASRDSKSSVAFWR